MSVNFPSERDIIVVMANGPCDFGIFIEGVIIISSFLFRVLD